MWINLFLQPDALSANEVEAHEEYLRMTCRYASENLDALKRLLYNTCNPELIDKLNISVDYADGGAMVWKKFSKLLQGQKTSNMLTFQATTNKTKIVEFAGLNVTKYHTAAYEPEQQTQSDHTLK